MSIAPSAIERLQDIAGGTGALGRQRHPHHRGRARRKQSGRPPQRVPLWDSRSPSPTSGRQLTWGCVCRVRGRSLSGVLELRMPKPDARRQLLDVFRFNAPERRLRVHSPPPLIARLHAAERYPQRAGVAGCVIATWLMTRCARRCTSQSAANMITITSTKPTIAAHVRSMLPD
jgi:hypothetical protein